MTKETRNAFFLTLLQGTAPQLRLTGGRASAGLVLAALSAGSALAQSTFGSIRGTVQDNSGAVIADASVEVHSLDENTDRDAKTGSDGAFVLENLKPGRYRVTIRMAGFSDAVVASATLDARQDLRLPVTLAIASEAQTVQVSGAASQIDTEDATLADSASNLEITQLPLNNRATTTSPLGSLSLSANVQQDSAGNIAINGATGAQVNFSVDGISTSNVRQNGALQDAYPSQEGISAVKVSAFDNSAEFSQVSDVTFTTKSGTSAFHGSLFEYLQNQALDANPYGFTGKAPKHFNTFGGSLGGPVKIPRFPAVGNKTFFFAAYEGNRRSTAVNQQFVLPSLLDRSGDLRDIGGPVIDPARISATSRALLSYYPLPNVADATPGSINYLNFQRTPSSTDGADLRIDRTLSEKQSVYARFSRKNITSQFANPLLPNDVDSIHNRSFLVSHTYTLTPSLLNEFRFGFTNVLTDVGFAIRGADAVAQLGLLNVNLSQHPDTNAFPTFNFNAGTNFQTIGRDKTGITQSGTYEFTDNLTWTRGRHTFKGGADIRRVRYRDIETFQPSDDFGQFTFQPTFTGNAFGDFLTGAPTTLFFAVSSPDVIGSTWQSGFYGQDTWQVSGKLTVNFGLRYQLLPPFKEVGGDLANFDQTGNSIIVPDALANTIAQQNLGASNLAFRQSFNSCDLKETALPCTQYRSAGQAGVSQGLRSTYHANWQPRVSIAYRPFNDTKTVVRAGFGIYTISNLGPLSFNNSGNPTSNLHTYSNTADAAGNPLITFPNTTPANLGVVYGGGNLDQGVDPNYRDPQSEQWNLTVERQLQPSTSLRVSYVGMKTYRLSITEDLNQIPASTTPYTTTPSSPYVDPRAPFHNWFELYSTFNHGKSNYQALEIEADQRLSHGLFFNANYTFAKNLADNQGDTPSSYAGEVNYGIPITDRFNTASDYGNVEGTRRNRLLITGIYQLPYGQGRSFSSGNRVLRGVLGDWDLTNVTLLQTGPWLTPSTNTGNDQSNTNVVNRGASLRPDAVSQNFGAGRSTGQYFNPAAFTHTPAGAGRFGNAGVGILQGPGTIAVALGTAKEFHVTERAKVRFESTFSNVLNHTNFAPPTTNIDNSLFGQLTSAQTADNAANRTGQVALRVDF